MYVRAISQLNIMYVINMTQCLSVNIVSQDRKQRKWTKECVYQQSRMNNPRHIIYISNSLFTVFDCEKSRSVSIYVYVCHTHGDRFVSSYLWDTATR